MAYRAFPRPVVHNASISTSSTLADGFNFIIRVFFEMFANLYGLRFRKSRTNSSSRLCQVLWTVAFVSFQYSRAKQHFFELSKSKDAFSCMDLADVINMLLDSVYLFRIMQIFVLKQKLLGELFDPDCIRSTDSVPLFILGLPYCVGHVSLSYNAFTEKPNALLNAVSCGYVWQTQSVFFIVYSGVISEHISKTKQLAFRLSKQWTRTDYLIEMKCKLRAEMDLINALFASTFALFYLKVLSNSIYTIGASIISKTNTFNQCMLILGHAGYILQLLFFAKRGSTVRDIHMRTELRLRETIWSHQPVSRDVMDAYKFRPKWDEFKVGGGFTLDFPSFVQYLGTCVTLVSVTLQFDYQVIRLLNQLALKT